MPDEFYFSDSDSVRGFQFVSLIFGISAVQYYHFNSLMLLFTRHSSN
jgi:hypothetical protein